MPISFNSAGDRQTYFSKPTDTSLTTVYTVGNAIRATLESVNIATEGAANVSVYIGNGTDYVLLPAVSLPGYAQVLHTFGNIVLLSGWTIKVQSSNANNVTFAIVVAEEYGDRLQ